MGKGRAQLWGHTPAAVLLQDVGAWRAGGEMQAEGGAGGAGLTFKLTCVWCAVMVVVGCDWALLKVLMRPTLLLRRVVLRMWWWHRGSPTCWTADGERPAPGVRPA